MARALVSTCTCILIFCRINLRCAIRTYFQTDRNFSLLLCRLGYPLLTSTILHTLGIYYITIPKKMAHFVLGLGFGIHFTLFTDFFSNVICTYLGSIQYNPVCEENYALRYFFQCDVLDTFLGMQFK